MAEIKISAFTFYKDSDFPTEIGGVPTVMVSWPVEENCADDTEDIPTGGWNMLYAKIDGKWVKQWELDTTPNGWAAWHEVTICIDGGDIYGYNGVKDPEQLMQEVCERLYTETDVYRNGEWVWVDIDLEERGCFPEE